MAAPPPIAHSPRPKSCRSTSAVAWLSLACAFGAIIACILIIAFTNSSLVVVVGIFALAAIAAGIIGLRQIWDRRGKGRLAAVTGLIGGLTMLAVSIFLPSMERTHHPHSTNRLACMRNIRQIGQAMRQYAIDDVREGNYPPDLETLYANSDLVEWDFICPISNAAPAPPPFVLGQNCSYVYLANGLTDSIASTVPVAYCQPHNHGNEGTSILFGEGVARFVLADQYPPEVQPTPKP